MYMYTNTTNNNTYYYHYYYYYYYCYHEILTIIGCTRLFEQATLISTSMSQLLGVALLTCLHAACLRRPRSLYACFVPSRITII